MDEEALNIPSIIGTIVATLALYALLGFCIHRLRRAPSTEDHRRWRRLTLVAGGVVLLWTVGLIWATVDFASFPLNR